MKWRALKYGLLLSLPLSAWIAFNHTGWLTLSSVFLAFVIIPVLELLLSPNPQNLTDAEERIVEQDRKYDYLLYVNVVLHWVLLFVYLSSLREQDLSMLSKVGRTLSMGVLCGVTGINLAHELGHRTKIYEKWLALSLLLTSLYMHFYIEHNRGHHKRVATEEDPASARFGEHIYAFWFRSGINSLIDAWKIENKRLRSLDQSTLSWQNEMVRSTVYQFLFVVAIAMFYGPIIALFFIAAAISGALLLETVNYIEHYGLTRAKKESGRYERVQPHHSWNSDHVVGRLFLFELSRHSDHHYLANRPYQVLRSYEKAPQMPTGYPGMMLMALIPPLWFNVMNRRVRAFASAAH